MQNKVPIFDENEAREIHKRFEELIKKIPKTVLTGTDKYYLNIAKAVAEKSTCLRRKFGAIIVKNNVIVGTGFNGAARGCTHCDKLGCVREKLGIERGQRYELCRSVHAEQNAIINAHSDIIGGTLYLYCETAKDIEPCIMCKRVILNAQLNRVVTPEKVFDVKEFIDADIIGYDNYANVSQSIVKTASAMHDTSMSLNEVINSINSLLIAQTQQTPEEVSANLQKIINRIKTENIEKD